MLKKHNLRRVIALHFISLGLVAFSFSAFADSQELVSGCQDKANSIKKQIEYANEHSNTHKVEGLKKALTAVETSCDEESLLKDRKDKIKEKEEKVEERRDELEEALSEGDSDKISKRERKLTEAQKALSEVKSELTGSDDL
ncbi:DUF1090 domain-containing protein [Cobetia sp. QF-1]|uniref:DUF1090 domain-containing protein n=1 Tax=Cobetia sp. QF-1 TaxID=1969833 RepID=UPI000B54050A|nr:DUF1090 domain-containing protein [Cobetia sp. QF-1]